MATMKKKRVSFCGTLVFFVHYVSLKPSPKKIFPPTYFLILQHGEGKISIFLSKLWL